MATVDIHYVRAALNCAVRKGIAAEPLLEQVGIRHEKLSQADARAHGDQMTRLVQSVWEALGDEFMGCTEHPCKPGAFAFMARHSLHYNSLGAVLRQGILFYNLFTDDIQMILEQQGDRVVLGVEFSKPELDPDYFFREFWLIIWHRFASWIIGKKIPLHEVSFTCPKPAHQSELKYLFPCQHRFNRPVLQFSFNAAFLSLAPVQTQRDLSQFLRHSPADLITIPGDEEGFRARIRSSLLHQDGNVLHCPSLERLAGSFNISSQTLRRKLKREGTSYPQIKDEIRRDLAVEKLFSQKLSVSEIAHSLGYSESRSFTRAFKQWTGVTPSAYLLRKE